MQTLLQSISHALPRPAPATNHRVLAWLPALGVTLLIAGIVARGCNYDLALPLRYLGYFGLQVALPGIVGMHLLGVRPASLSVLVSLAIPTGFAIEIFSFLGLSALGAQPLMALLPVVWGTIGVLQYRRQPTLGRSLSLPSPRVAFALSILVLLTVLAAASQMYAEAPLVDGLPQRPIFHDWVYLLSRAATIKHVWPLQDPSLAGTALQYHYFLLVHVAAASVGTGLDVTWILLRLAIVPLGCVLVLQAYALGKHLSGSRWGGVLAATLALVPGELSFAGDYSHLTYLGLFVRWLYVSPTFYFGMIYFGALLLAVPLIKARPGPLFWLVLLAAAGTAAKGSVLPVVLGALALWAVWTVVAERRLARRQIVVGACLTATFVLVYAFTMAAWGSGDAIVQPFRICQITDFWQRHAIPITRALKRGLHAPDFGTWLGGSITAAGVLAGTAGVRLLALPLLLTRQPAEQRALVRWLFATVVASAAFGLALHFDGDGELYFLLPLQLPLAVLAAGSAVLMVRRWRARRAAARDQPARMGQVLQYATLAATAAVFSVCLAVQVGTTVQCQVAGLRDWLHCDPHTKINADLVPLYQTTEWVREHTEPNAVLVSNAFTSPNLKRGRGVLVDHTTAGVYYYYSALTERRMWVEGPTYLLDQAEARRRLVRSAEMFYHANARVPQVLRTAPSYVILDHSIGDDAAVPAGAGPRVFSNERFEIFRLGPQMTKAIAKSR